MTYRDDLEAAQHRIAELERQLEELKGTKAPPVVNPPLVEESPSLPKRSFGGRTIAGFPVVIALIAGSCAVGQPLCGRACGAMTDSTEPAMKALRACSRAQQELGDDIHWGMVGCANCEGEGGGDPFNGGCHSSSDWQMPVSGSRGHGSYTWSFSQPAGKSVQFNGGRVTMANGNSISISPNGCD